MLLQKLPRVDTMKVSVHNEGLADPLLHLDDLADESTSVMSISMALRDLPKHARTPIYHW